MNNNEKALSLDAITVERLTGEEPLSLGGADSQLKVLDFWRWSVSDLVSNLTRGRLAEFIVAQALGIDLTKGVRNEWDAFDLLIKDGVKVEIKCSAYVQRWHQRAHSNIAWSVGPTRAWLPERNEFEKESKLQADVYVLFLLDEKDKGVVEPLNLDQWSFFVVPRRLLGIGGSRGRSRRSRV